MDYQQLAHVFQNVIKLMSDNLLSQTECVNCCVWILGNFKAIYATITEINWGKCSGYRNAGLSQTPLCFVHVHIYRTDMTVVSIFSPNTWQESG